MKKIFVVDHDYVADLYGDITAHLPLLEYIVPVTNYITRDPVRE